MSDSMAKRRAEMQPYPRLKYLVKRTSIMILRAAASSCKHAVQYGLGLKLLAACYGTTWAKSILAVQNYRIQVLYSAPINTRVVSL
jgi:hypothetical protein